MFIKKSNQYLVKNHLKNESYKYFFMSILIFKHYLDRLQSL